MRSPWKGKSLKGLSIHNHISSIGLYSIAIPQDENQDAEEARYKKPNGHRPLRGRGEEGERADRSRSGTPGESRLEKSLCIVKILLKRVSIGLGTFLNAIPLLQFPRGSLPRLVRINAMTELTWLHRFREKTERDCMFPCRRTW